MPFHFFTMLSTGFGKVLKIITYSTQHIKLEGYIPFMLMLNFVISANINYAFISRLRMNIIPIFYVNSVKIKNFLSVSIQNCQ